MNKMTDEILYRLSNYLNYNEKGITKDLINNVKECGVDTLSSYKLLLTSFLGLDDNSIFKEKYIDKMVSEMDRSYYTNNPYYKNVILGNIKYKDWEFKYSKYDAYEAFVYDDFLYDNDLVIPRIGYFTKDFKYPGIYYKNRLWMSVTPNEINTMKKPIENAFGNVLTFGLGLGYFIYMCSLKDTVEKITVVEIDNDVIYLFKKYILPKFEFKDKITIINTDAYKYLNDIKDNEYDYIFVDIYHDASDGISTYNKMKDSLSKFKKTIIDFWIMDTIKYYL